jgi:hypothetical protein
MSSLLALAWSYTPLPLVGFLLGGVVAGIWFLLKWCFLKQPKFGVDLEGRNNTDWIQQAVDSKVSAAAKKD